MKQRLGADAVVSSPPLFPAFGGKSCCSSSVETDCFSRERPSRTPWPRCVCVYVCVCVSCSGMGARRCELDPVVDERVITVSQLWALLHFIMPTLFDSHEEFNEWFSKDIESHAENKSAIDESECDLRSFILCVCIFFPNTFLFYFTFALWVNFHRRLQEII